MAHRNKNKNLNYYLSSVFNITLVFKKKQLYKSYFETELLFENMMSKVAPATYRKS